MRRLSELLPGERGVVLRVEDGSALFGRFMDLGIIPGTKIQCVIKSPLGDPVAYFIRGALISLRREDSVNIIIK